jgi:hypothetical protein
MIGIPTPYVSWYPSKMWVKKVDAGVSVLNFAVLETVIPLAAVAVAVTVYDCETFSAQSERQDAWSVEKVPVTGSPAVCTETFLSVPCAVLTVIPCDGSAPDPPLPGVMVIAAAAAALAAAEADAAAAALALALALAALAPPDDEDAFPAGAAVVPVPVHAVTATASTAIAALYTILFIQHPFPQRHAHQPKPRKADNSDPRLPSGSSLGRDQRRGIFRCAEVL